MFRPLVKRAPALLASIGLLATAAPAMAHSRTPTASDFELAPAQPQALSAASGRVLSKPLRAPRRFNLVGLRWRGSAQPAIALRVRRSGGHWTRWLQLPGAPDGAPDPHSAEARAARATSAPVWVGSANWVQYRLSRRVPGLRLHFVQVDSHGWHPRAVAAQAAGQPPIQARSSWDPGNACPPRTAPQYGDAQVAFIHHTVSLNDYTAADVPSIILGICRFHRNSNGWNDIGYNFLVDKFGTLWEGRAGGIDQPVVGAQAQGFNSQSTGIANIGTFDDIPETNAAMSSMAALIRWKLPLTGAPTAGTTSLVSAGGSDNRFPAGTRVTLNRVSGHRDVDATDCPGTDLYGQLPTLRTMVGSVTAVKARTRIAAAFQPALVVFPQTTRIAGSVALINSTPLGSEPLQIQLFGKGTWHTVARGSSAADGTFSVPLAPHVAHQYRVVYAGDGSHLSSTSPRLNLTVQPRVTIRRSVKRTQVGRTPTISGSIAPAKTSLRLVVNRQVGKKLERVASFKLRVTNGQFRKSYRLTVPGLYSYRVIFAGDAANVKASSTTLHVRAL
ncbi:MAG TPA: N-acetylmuramoyl-L-alanine amidase [Thermoleophilaceae bacterium]